MLWPSATTKAVLRRWRRVEEEGTEDLDRNQSARLVVDAESLKQNLVFDMAQMSDGVEGGVQSG